MLNNDNEISAILVTGGVGGEGVILNTAELFHMNGTRQCSLPSLKSPRKCTRKLAFSHVAAEMMAHKEWVMVNH